MPSTRAMGSREGASARTIARLDHRTEMDAQAEELRLALIALNEREGYLRTLLETTLDGFWVLDGEGRILRVNSAYCEMTGYGQDELLRMRVSDVEAIESAEETAGHIRQIQEQGFSRFGTSHRRKDGGIIHLEVSITFVGQGRGLMVCFFQEVTARKKAESERSTLQAQVATSSRLAALGTLVAGVAHEINNPLAGALACQAMAIDELRKLVSSAAGGEPLDREAVARSAAEVIKMLCLAQNGAAGIARIVKDLTSFGCPDPGRSPVQLPDVVQSALRWLRVSVERVATIHVEAGQVPEVLASPGQLEQVVVNLVTNAARAIPDGRPGRIVIRIGPGSPGMARLEVADDGGGIAPGVIGRIFEPFFTTRNGGAGAGLGLAICHAIVTAHGGTLTVESEVGKGATFRVELPTPADEP